MSPQKTEILVHVGGKLVLRSEVASGLQYVEKDGSGNFFIFAKPGDQKPLIPASDQVLIAAPSWRGTPSGSGEPFLFSTER